MPGIIKLGTWDNYSWFSLPLDLSLQPTERWQNIKSPKTKRVTKAWTLNHSVLHQASSQLSSKTYGAWDWDAEKLFRDNSAALGNFRYLWATFGTFGQLSAALGSFLNFSSPGGDNQVWIFGVLESFLLPNRRKVLLPKLPLMNGSNFSLVAFQFMRLPKTMIIRQVNYWYIY